jgi:hypothetical protein
MRSLTFYILALGASLTEALPSNEAAYDLPKKVIAGVEVAYTPIIADAIEYARANSDNVTFNHVMRSFLFDSIQLSANASLANVDKEVLALGAILHDLGLDNTPGSRLISLSGALRLMGRLLLVTSSGHILMARSGTKDECSWCGMALRSTQNIRLLITRR